jgi:hypothetical protein
MNITDMMNVPEVIVQPREVHLDPRMAEVANNSLKNAATFQSEGGSGKVKTGRTNLWNECLIFYPEINYPLFLEIHVYMVNNL